MEQQIIDTCRTYYYIHDVVPNALIAMPIMNIVKAEGPQNNKEKHYLTTDDGIVHTVRPGWVRVITNQPVRKPEEKEERNNGDDKDRGSIAEAC